MNLRPKEDITSYHVHIYYEGHNKQWAGHLRREIAKLFKDAVVGRWHDTPVGPHPVSSYQIAFEPDLFGEIVPWLSLNRKDLHMLLHPNTGDGYEDHAINMMWIGPSIELSLDSMRKRYEAKIRKEKEQQPRKRRQPRLPFKLFADKAEHLDA